MTERPLVYVAGYYSAHPAHGTKDACDAWFCLLGQGVTPLVPHLGLLLDILHPMKKEFWYEYDLALLARCDAMFVVPQVNPGLESEGVQNEIAFAKEHGIPVIYHSYSAVGNWAKQWKKVRDDA